MKEFLAVISLLVGAVVAEPPAPYPASGWRPSGPAFELPQRGDQPAQYIPPVDPRNQARGPNVEYGFPDDDVSVQGLPTQEENPYFQKSPINGKQNVGADFNSDIQNLNRGFQQSQYQIQQQRYREYERQRQIEAQIQANRQPKPQAPAAILPRTTPTTEATTTETVTTETTKKESKNSNEKIKVEVSKQNIQELPGEFFLSSLAQLQLQPQFVPLQQFDQLKAPLYIQPAAQKQVGYDATIHFAALPSVLAQQRLQQQKLEQPALLITEQVQPQSQIQPVAYQPTVQPAVRIQTQPEQTIQPQTFYGQPNELYQPTIQPQAQYPAQPVILQPQANVQTSQFQPQMTQFQPQFQPQSVQLETQSVQLQPQPAQFQPQPVQFQPQPAQFQPQPAQFQPQPTQFQPQPAQFQPQPSQFQPQQEQDAENIDNTAYQPLYQPQLIPQNYNQYSTQFSQPGLIQAQLVSYPGQDYSQFQQQQLQQQFQQQAQQQNRFDSQGADALQSGFDVNQQGNDIDESKNQDEGKDDENTATAVATAFGTRTQPRVFTQYGSPYPVPKVQAAPSTTESAVEDVTDDGPVVAHAVAIADGSKKKSAKLRRNRVRPIFTLDRTGHLVLAQQ